MKRCLFYYTCLFLPAVVHVAVFAAPKPRSLSKDNLHFIENKGQVTDQHHNPRPDIHFKIPAANGLSIFIGAGKIHYQWTKYEATTPSSRPQWRDLTLTEGDTSVPLRSAQGGERVAMYRMDVTLLHANPHAEIVTEQKQPYYEQYYLPYTDKGGATAHAYRKITYREVYPHIDWVFYINAAGKAEHDFIVHPGGKVSDIRLLYAGATEMRLNDDGSVTAVTPFGSVTENTPYCYQQDGREVAARFLLNGNTLSFSTAAYEGMLTIDPVLEWGTYYGGADGDFGTGVVTAASGDVYLTGYTKSTANIATTGSHQSVYAANNDVFLAKCNSAGQRQWGTYYGGNNDDRSASIAIDTAGNVYLAGLTKSDTGIATPGVHKDVYVNTSTSNRTWFFLAKFNGEGQRQWGTYYSGSNAENIGPFVTCDLAGNTYITGYAVAASTDIATAGSYKLAPDGIDAFLVKFTPAGQRVWGTWYGGTGADKVSGIACDKDGHIYLSGFTNSNASGDTGIATPGSHQQTYGGGNNDAFLAKFDAAGSRIWGTYYGGALIDQGAVVRCDHAGNVYLGGSTTSTSAIATPPCHQDTFAGGVADAFVVKFDADGQRQWGTYYGGSLVDLCGGVDFDRLGNVYVAGRTTSTENMATTGIYKDTADGQDAYLVKFDSAGVRQWGTYYGGPGSETATSLACDRYGNIYFTGQTNSTAGITTPGSHQPVHGGTGGNTAYLVKFNDCDTPLAPDSITGPVYVCPGGVYTYVVPVLPGVVSYIWTLPAGWTGTSVTDSIIAAAGNPGSSDTIRITANYLCGSSPEQYLPVTVAPQASVTPAGAQSACAGDSIILHGNTEQDITWQWLEQGSPVTGGTDSIYVVHQSGSYRLSITGNGQCRDTSDEITVTIHPLPQPEIIANGAELSVAGVYTAYQWNHNGNAITGATGSVYTVAIQEGNYTVTVTDSNGCANTSLPYAPLAIPGLIYGEEIKIYPNPAQTVVYIAAARAMDISVYTLQGHEVLHQRAATSINIGSLPVGIYTLRVKDSGGHVQAVYKLLKTGY